MLNQSIKITQTEKTEVSPRMFKSDFLEYFSHVHPYTPLVVYTPVITYFLYQSFSYYQLSLLKITGLFFLAILVWSFAEYILHRYVFHFEIDTEWSRRLHFFLHGVHHHAPNDFTRLVMPPGFSIPLAILLYYGLKSWIGNAYTAPFFAGFITGYLWYDMTHYIIHRYNFKNKYMKELKKHHMKHHHTDHDNGFGVSSFIWDYVFKTQKFSPKKLKTEK